MADNLPMSYEDMKSMAKDMHQSGFFASIKNPQQALVTILAGRELGMGPFESMSNIYVIQGRPAFYAHKYGDMIKRHGKYDYKIVEHTNEKCTIDFFQDGEKTGTSTFTLDDAKVAGLNNDNWRKYPRNMLFARAITNGARWHCADAFNGAAYEPEELGAVVEYDDQGTQTVISVPNEKVYQPEPSVEPETPTQDTQTSEPVPTVQVEDDGTPHFKQEYKDTTASGFKLGTDMKVLTVSTFTELQSANGKAYAKITFIDVFTVEGIRPRWAEYNVSPFVFEEQPDLYRKLDNGVQVLVSLAFENKGEKNYQNCEVLKIIEPTE